MGGLFLFQKVFLMLDFDHPLKGLLKPCLSIHIRVIVSNSMMISPYEFGARRGVRRTRSVKDCSRHFITWRDAHSNSDLASLRSLSSVGMALRCPVDEESQGQLDDVLG